MELSPTFSKRIKIKNTDYLIRLNVKSSRIRPLSFCVEEQKLKKYNSIHERLDKVSLPELMGASNIFGRGLGIKRVVVIMNEYPDILTSKDNETTKFNENL